MGLGIFADKKQSQKSTTITKAELYPYDSQKKFMPTLNHTIFNILSFNAQKDSQQGDLFFDTLWEEMNKSINPLDMRKREDETPTGKAKIFLTATQNTELSWKNKNIRDMIAGLVEDKESQIK